MKNEIRKCNSCGIPISEYERRRRDSLGLLVCHYCFMHPKFPTGSPVTASQAVDVEKATSVEEGEQTYDTTHGRIAVQRGTVLTAYLRGKTVSRSHSAADSLSSLIRRSRPSVHNRSSLSR